MKKQMKRLLGLLLALAMVLSLMPEMSRKVYAYENNPYAALIPTDNDDAAGLAAKQITFNGKNGTL